MEYLVYTGAALTVLGLVGLIWSIFTVNAARRVNLSASPLRPPLQALFPWTLVALGPSALGIS